MASVGNSGLRWWKSSFSSQGDCVEVAFAGRDQVFVRDSKDPDGPVLQFSLSEWAALAAGVKAGEFDQQ